MYLKKKRVINEYNDNYNKVVICYMLLYCYIIRLRHNLQLFDKTLDVLNRH